MPLSLVISVALLQGLVVTMWTVYALFLPGLLEQVDLPRSVVPWLVLIDQGLFLIADIGMGLATDRITRLFGRLGPWLAGMSLVCCLAFLAIPWVANGPGSRHLLLGAVVVWVLCSSALRAPPLALLAKLSNSRSLPGLTLIVLLGLALARVAAPYLQMQLHSLDPRWPFAITSGVLLLVVLVTIRLEPHQVRTMAEPAGRALRSPWSLLTATLILAVGIEIHTFLQTKTLLGQFVDAEHLVWLSPTFWLSCCLGLALSTSFIHRDGGAAMLPGLALLGTGGLLLVGGAADLASLLLGLLMTGLAWGGCLNATVSALLLGSPGREGIRLGLWSATLALAALLRVGLVLTGLAGQTSVLVPALLWGGAMLLMLLIKR